MRIIDAHMHFSDIQSFHDCAAKESLLDYSLAGYVKESETVEIAASICMGLSETSPGRFPDSLAKTPMLADLASSVDAMPEGMYLCPGINPHALDEYALAALKKLAGHERVVGFKIYAGYYHFDVNDAAYEPVYRLAMEQGMTIAVHSGDTFSHRGLLEYSHPLRVDRLAVTHRNMNIVICHLGVPWIFDACELAYKNPNVYLDMSGLLVANTKQIQGVMKNQLQLDRYIQALEFLSNYKKLLYGSDWPLAPMAAYGDFIQALIPPSEYGDVFYHNAKRAYPKLSID